MANNRRGAFKPPPTPEERHRRAAFAEYIRENHPALHEYNEKRAAFWQALKAEAVPGFDKSALTKLAGWERENPPPIAWERQAEILQAFSRSYSSPSSS